jgi:hypothetical protein
MDTRDQSFIPIVVVYNQPPTRTCESGHYFPTIIELEDCPKSQQLNCYAERRQFDCIDILHSFEIQSMHRDQRRSATTKADVLAQRTTALTHVKTLDLVCVATGSSSFY